MELNRLTREADELIRKVVARYNSLYSPGGMISQVELDLLLDDLRLMYEKFKTIGQLNLQHMQQESRKITLPPPPKHESSAENTPLATSPHQKEPEPAQAVKEELQPEIKSDLLTTSAALKDEPMNSTVDAEAESSSRTDLLPDSKEPAKDRPARFTTPHVQEELVQTLADKYKNSQKSLSDVMSAGTDDESLGSRLGHQPLSDLKSVIGIAEKFAFINELFGGDPIAYEKAIVQLNGATRLTEAEAYLGTLRLNHKWPSDSSQAELLTELIRRKFGA